MEWHVKLKGTSDLERLSKCVDLPNCTITKKGNEYILKSQLFSKLEDAHDVDIKAEGLVSRINAIAAVLFNYESPIKSYTVARTDDEGRETQFILPKPIELTVRMGTPTVLVGGVVQGKSIEEKYVDLLDLAFKDKDVGDLFGILREDNDWHELYGIYEIIERNVKDQEKLLKLSGLTSTAELKDLVKTMQMNRHTRKKPRHKHPEKPYTIKETRQIMRKLVDNWIDIKLTET